jgi:hypothetical protein
MNQFVLFAGDDYYPLGGMWDYVDSFDTLGEAKAIGENSSWAHIAELPNLLLVAEWHNGEYKNRVRGWWIADKYIVK